jgi:uncharacterized phiE125 gp8 family phage protein
MPAKLTLITAPAVEPVSVNDVLEHSRIDDSTEENLIRRLIRAARHEAENITGRALITQTWKLNLNEFPGNGYGSITLPRPPFQSISSVTYLDTNGATQSLTDSPTSNWILVSGEPTVMTPDYDVTWPSTYDVPDAVSIRFICGYGDDPEDVPDPIRQWILIHAATMYEYREASFERPLTPHTFVDRLLDSYRTCWF